MEQKAESSAWQVASAFRAEAVWHRFRADLADGMATQMAAAAELEHDYACRMAAEYPQLFEPPPVDRVDEPTSEIVPPPTEEHIGDAATDDVDGLIALAGMRPSVPPAIDDLPGGLIEARQRSKKTGCT